MGNTEQIAQLRRLLASDATIPGRARRAGEAMLSNGRLCFHGSNSELATLAGVSYSTATRSLRDLTLADYGKHFTNRDHQSVWLWHANTKLTRYFYKLSVRIDSTPQTGTNDEIADESAIEDALSSVMSCADLGTIDRVMLTRLTASYADLILQTQPPPLGGRRWAEPTPRQIRAFGDPREYTPRELDVAQQQVAYHLSVAQREGRPSIGFWRGFRGYLYCYFEVRP